MHKVLAFEGFLSEMDRTEFGGVWVSGGYKESWIDEPTARRFDRPGLLVVQDLFPSPLMDRATYQLPAAAFAEHEGSYVNWTDRLQTANMAVRPPWGVRGEGPLFWQMSGRKGLYNSRAVLDDLSREILTSLRPPDRSRKQDLI